MSSLYEELFHLIDADGGGTLSLEEVQEFCEKLGLPTAPSPQVIARLFVQADADKSNAIDKDEFTALCEGIKLVVGMSESQMVDAYATNEMQRLFSYLCTNNGNTMRKDELRKAMDVLNHALRLDHPDPVLNGLLRDVTEVDFEEFKALLGRLCPDRTLTSVANVFLMEERRRREHLLKVKSMYEMRNARNTRGGPHDDGVAHTAVPDKKCSQCPLKDQHIETLMQQIATMLEENRSLQGKVRDIGDAALREVEFNNRIKKMQNQFAEEMEKSSSVEAVNKALRESVAAVTNQLEELQRTVAQQQQIALERDQLLLDFGLLEKEQETTRQEVQNLQDRLVRKSLELSEAQANLERTKVRLQERDERILDLERRESELSVKEIESLRMQRLMADMRDRCEKRELELSDMERLMAEERFRVIEREQQMEQREDMITAMERAVRRNEIDSQEKWETVFRKAQAELDMQQEKINVRELEQTQKEAEFAVREQIFDANQRKAESTSLPERERRLKLLQSIETQLAARERNIRVPERQYMHAMLQPELITLREENHQLQTQVVKLRVEIDSQHQRFKDEVEKSKAERLSWIEKSKLSIEMAAIGGGSGQVAGGSFAAARSRRASIVGGTPPVYNKAASPSP
ncbi:Ca2+-binding protein, putative [Bodo saltans]|uniref:Ca2+-binding protein, putative n=1 Tax=Bodo saltans TaxID=75058 RepID=A0A0S4KMD5_BODSA|nr:Ca2+-binding protein, putative [Bodo saltans]|eukprot:CUI14648.1 Ca2+-binding protein, putative [Bodo saltans]